MHLSQGASVQPGSIIAVFLIFFNICHAVHLAAGIVAVQVAGAAIGRVAALGRDGHKLCLGLQLVHGAFAQPPCAEIRSPRY